MVAWRAQVGVIIGLTVALNCAAQEAVEIPTALTPTISSTGPKSGVVQPAFRFKTHTLPSLNIQLTSVNQYQPVVIPGLSPVYGNSVQNLSFSASRRFFAQFPQHVFARLTASSVNNTLYPSQLFAPNHSGLATSIGWQLGDPDQLNMAVEVQHREMADESEAVTLTLGVQYYF